MLVPRPAAPSLRLLAKSSHQSITRNSLVRSIALLRCQSNSAVSSSPKPATKPNELAKVIRDSIKVYLIYTYRYRNAHHTYSQLDRSPHPATCNSAYPIPSTDTTPKATYLVKRGISSPLLKSVRYLGSSLPYGS